MRRGPHNHCLTMSQEKDDPCFLYRNQRCTLTLGSPWTHHAVPPPPVPASCLLSFGEPWPIGIEEWGENGGRSAATSETLAWDGGMVAFVAFVGFVMHRLIALGGVEIRGTCVVQASINVWCQCLKRLLQVGQPLCSGGGGLGIASWATTLQRWWWARDASCPRTNLQRFLGPRRGGSQIQTCPTCCKRCRKSPPQHKQPNR